MMYRAALLLLLHINGALGEATGCTTIVVGRKATVDGSPIVTHSADSTTGDFRVVYVPARDHAPGSNRAVFRREGFWNTYPRSTDTERSASYLPVENPVHDQQIVGYIPQVPHTYALWEGMYSFMNEHGLALGESTCCGKLVNSGVPDGGTALLSVANLMSLALERCRTALCAVETMGQLAEQYGFYGEDPGIDGAGEAVTAADAEGHAWVFHVTGGAVNKTGALWVAQRVPEGHVAVVANSFAIKEVDMDDVENFRGSDRLLEHAVAAGVWDGKGRFNWQASLSPDYDTHFEASANAMDPLRMWRVFTLANPELTLKPSNRLADMPFSVAPTKKVSNLMVMDWHRDTYDGTEFDMTMGALAGPFQSPRRHRGGSGIIPGQAARSISMHWTLYCHISQTAVKHPVLWFAPDSAKTTVFVPFYAEVLSGDGRYSMKDYGEGSSQSFSFAPNTPRPAWWAFNFVADWLELSYNNMSKTFVFPKVHQLQNEVLLQVQQGEAAADKLEDNALAGHLAELHTKIQEHVASEWWTLAGNLVNTYNDQSFNTPMETVGLGWPDYYLEMAGYNPRSYYPGWMQPSTQLPSTLAEEDLSLAKQSLSLSATCGAVGLDATKCDNFLVSLGASMTTASNGQVFPVGTLLFGVACAAIGFWAGSKRPSSQTPAEHAGYLRIE